ncbi:H-NS-like global regulator TsrA [Vibrio sp.]|uniref:H-NS-like global regulator TsrA n=1 Tax=Vibrio sp. TaxID=678 RepID=UPI003AA8E6C7
MSLTTYEMARILEQMEESPEKIMFGKLLTELGNQSQERIRSAAKQVPLELLRDIIYQFQVIADSRKGEQVQLLAEQLKAQGLSVEDLKRYMEKTK